jgi:hypothetical protein
MRKQRFHYVRALMTAVFTLAVSFTAPAPASPTIVPMVPVMIPGVPVPIFVAKPIADAMPMAWAWRPFTTTDRVTTATDG